MRTTKVLGRVWESALGAVAARLGASLVVILALGLAGAVPGCGGGEGSGELEVVHKPKLAVRPALTGDRYDVDLGEVPVGAEQATVIRLYDIGKAALSIEELRFAYTPADPEAEAERPAFTCTYGPDSRPCDDPGGLPAVIREDGGDETLPAELAVTITFLRYADGQAREATLTVVSDDDESPRVLTFGTTEAIPRIQVTPPRVTFEGGEKGVVETRFFSVVSAGTDTLVLDRFTLDADEEFTLVLDGRELWTDEETRGGLELDPPVELAPNESLDVEVRYVPTTPDGADGVFQLRSNDPDAEWSVVYLEGLQSGPVLRVNPGRLEFGPRTVGTEAVLQLQLLSAGTEPLVIDRLELAADRTSPDFALGFAGLTESGEPVGPDNPLVIPANGHVLVEVYYTPDVANEYDELSGAPVLDEGAIVIGNDSFEREVEVGLSGYGVLQECPRAVIVCDEGEQVRPQTTVHCYGDQSYGMVGEIQQWEWRIDQPVGSQELFQPSPAFPQTNFTMNVVGTYTLYLDVYDSDGQKSCEPAKYEIAVIPDEAIHIELLWTTPGDPDETDQGPFAGSDMDLHFIHPNAPSDPNASDIDGDGLPDPYFDQPWDCYWFNPHPDWASFGDAIDDDPGLDRDDTDGAGPENVNLNVPENDTTYEVAVHYWNDHGYGAGFATVRIYIYETLVFEQSNIRLINYDMWSVARIHWPTGQVTAVTDENGQYDITPNYQPPMFFQ